MNCVDDVKTNPDIGGRIVSTPVQNVKKALVKSVKKRVNIDEHVAVVKDIKCI